MHRGNKSSWESCVEFQLPDIIMMNNESGISALQMTGDYTLQGGVGWWWWGGGIYLRRVLHERLPSRIAFLSSALRKEGGKDLNTSFQWYKIASFKVYSEQSPS